LIVSSFPDIGVGSELWAWAINYAFPQGRQTHQWALLRRAVARAKHRAEGMQERPDRGDAHDLRRRDGPVGPECPESRHGPDPGVDCFSPAVYRRGGPTIASDWAGLEFAASWLRLNANANTASAYPGRFARSWFPCRASEAGGMLHECS